jgi:membrane protein
MEKKNTVRRLWEFVAAVAWRFFEDRSSQTAGALTYTSLLSIVPLLTVALALASAFPVFDQAVANLQDFVKENVLPDAPGFAAFTEQIRAFTSRAGRLTAIGVAGLGITSVLLMLTIDESLNRIFRVRRRRPLGLRLITYWAVITLAPLLVGGSLSITSYLIGAAHAHLELPRIAQYPLGILPFVLTWGALALIYTFVPHRHVEWRHGVLAALLAGVAFEVAKRGFAFYIGHFPTYAFIYGTFATILIFLLWLYVSWVIVLVGATLTAMLPAWRSVGAQRGHVPGRGFAEVLGVLGVLARAQAVGKVVSAMAISKEVGLMPHRVEEILDRALALGWVASAQKETWLLTRSADSLRLDEIYRAFVFDPDSVGIGERDLGRSLLEFSTEPRA